MVLDRSEVLVEDLLFFALRSLRSTSIREVEKWPKTKSRLSMTFWLDQLNTTSQNGSWTDKKTHETVNTLNWSPIKWILHTERILRDWESPSNTEVLDITGALESEVREPSPLVDVVRLSVLPERRSEFHSRARSVSFFLLVHSSVNAVFAHRQWVN